MRKFKVGDKVKITDDDFKGKTRLCVIESFYLFGRENREKDSNGEYGYNVKFSHGHVTGYYESGLIKHNDKLDKLKEKLIGGK